MNVSFILLLVNHLLNKASFVSDIKDRLEFLCTYTVYVYRLIILFEAIIHIKSLGSIA